MEYLEICKIDTSKLLVGTKQILRALGENTLKCVVIAEDTDQFIKDVVGEACKGKDVKIVSAPDKTELGKLCGIKVGAATCGILR